VKLVYTRKGGWGFARFVNWNDNGVEPRLLDYASGPDIVEQKENGFRTVVGQMLKHFITKLVMAWCSIFGFRNGCFRFIH